MNVLAIDIGGTHVKFLVSGEKETRKFPSGPTMTPQMMVAGVKKLAADWNFEAISAAYPGPVLHNRPVTEPHNLAKGWTTFDFQRALKRPVKFMNDAAMQALGSYRGGKLLFLGLGTGLGTTMTTSYWGAGTRSCLISCPKGAVRVTTRTPFSAVFASRRP